MCFSAEVSFITASALGIIGIPLVKKFRDDPKLLLALIPWFFAIQQFSEGVLWIALKNGSYPSSYSIPAQSIYLFFAYVFWPFWIPFAFYIIETIPWRKYVLAIFLFLGSIFAVVDGYYLIFFEKETAYIAGKHITYGESLLFPRLVYLFIVLVPFFVSHLSRMWILGIAIGLSFLFVEWFYHYAFVSLWCFWAAVVSIGIFFCLKKEEKQY